MIGLSASCLLFIAVSTLPATTAISALDAYPPQVHLRGSDASQQLVITASLANGSQVDFTGDLGYAVADPRVVKVTAHGRVVPLADGQTEIIASYGGKSLKIPVTIEATGVDLPLNFGNQVVPIFTKLGCNSGGCHGKGSGQNGFKLSLLGFEPRIDFDALVKEDRGRRLFPAAPDRSLLLLKATGASAHGGGKRLEPSSDEYRILRRWIAAGTPWGKRSDPVITGLSVYPEGRVLTRGGRQQVAAFAHYNDGSVEDVTRRVQYDSNDPEVAGVEPAGLVRTAGHSGEAAIMARYQGQVAVFRATVPVGPAVTGRPFPPQTLVDAHTERKWHELGLLPSGLCSDEQFVRRAYLDVIGTLPTPAEVHAFVLTKDLAKRAHLIDSLLERPEYAYFFATKWADVLHVKRGRNPSRAYGTFAFHNWIRESISADKPFNDFAREILTATGDETRCPPTVWYKELQTPDQLVDNTTQVFLGMRLACAQCHHHPYEKWSQDDYWSLAAYFGRLGRKNIPVPGSAIRNQMEQRQVLYARPSGGLINKKSGQTAVPKPLDSDAVTSDLDNDPRQQLADWMVDAKNPFFARAVVNRYWAHFFGRGLVEPLDDMRVTNPPSNPELLDHLARDFIEHGYSLKHLIRTLANSRTYQLDAVPNETNRQDKQTFARFYPRRLSAEILFDAVCQVTGSPASFNNLPADVHAPRRAIMLPDESFTSYFLDVFGRPQRISGCECERVSEANLAQALHLLNSEEVQRKLAQPGGRAEILTRDPRPDAEKVEELFLWAFARSPTPGQLQTALDHLAAFPKNKKPAYENILWALINTKEFLFNR